MDASIWLSLGLAASSRNDGRQAKPSQEEGAANLGVGAWVGARLGTYDGCCPVPPCVRGPRARDRKGDWISEPAVEGRGIGDGFFYFNLF